jgi:hypothetical protein
MPEGFLEQVRGLLLNAKLTTNLAEYITRLRLYMNVLLAEDPTGRTFLEATAKVVFLQGCPDDLQQLLRSDQVSNPHITFFEMCAKAEGFDNIYAFCNRLDPYQCSTLIHHHHRLATCIYIAIH